MFDYCGGTMRGQHECTLDMLREKIGERPSVAEILWFLYDCQTDSAQLKTLAEMAQKREEHARAAAAAWKARLVRNAAKQES